MVVIKDLFSEILERKASLSAVQNGNQFEEAIYRVFNQFGLTKYRKEDTELKDFVKSIQPIAQNKLESNVTVNDIALKNWYVPQAYGSQNVPDILCGLTETCFPIEIKCTKTGNIVWNGSFPRVDCVYICCGTNARDITIFNGSDILTNEERERLLEYWKILREIDDKSYKCSYGFIPYLRQTFNDGVNSWLKNPKRRELEGKCFEFLETLK